VTDPALARGGVAGVLPHPTPPAREVVLFQRRAGKPGATLGKTTGWIHRALLKMKKVQMIGDARYERISDRGIQVSFGEERAKPTWFEVDNVVLCTGQQSQRELAAPLTAAGVPVHVIGGAHEAAELDAKRAIDQATRLAASL
jgi:2,4-dienoyl-CoA reductase (NADPH2)